MFDNDVVIPFWPFFYDPFFFFFARHAWRSMVMKKVMFAFPDSSPFPYRDGTRKNQHRNTPGI